MKKTMLISISILATLYSCGKTPEQKAQEQREKYYNNFKNGEECGENVIDDYNLVVSIKTRKIATEFNKKYPNINCTAFLGEFDKVQLQVHLKNFKL